MTNILIVDDHPIVRRGLQKILATEPTFVVHEATTAHEALRLIKTLAFDLAVVDLNLPGMNGIELLKEIKRIAKQTQILVLSVYPEDQFAVRVLRAGASGFVSKEVAPDDLVTAIKTVLKGGKHIPDQVADLLLAKLERGGDGPIHEKLSDREFEILCLFGEGRSIKQIAEKLSLSAPTVSTYRARILNKLDMKNTAELVKYAIQHKIAKPQ